MRNNPCKNMIKVLTPKKNDRLIIQRIGNDYFMTECHIAYKVNATFYATYYHGEKPLVFPLLEDGQCISNGAPCEMNVKGLFEQHKPDASYDAICTDFIKDCNGDLARLYLVYDKSGSYVPMLINESFHKAIDCFNCTIASGGSNNKPLSLYDHDHDLFCIVCPINYGNENLRKHGKALADLSNIDLLTAKTNIA